jgi:hypothetical protein
MTPSCASAPSEAASALKSNTEAEKAAKAWQQAASGAVSVPAAATVAVGAGTGVAGDDVQWKLQPSF